MDVNKELLNYDINDATLKIISDKDGISVHSVKTATDSYVIKCYDNVDYRRELTYYDLFNMLSINTIDVIGKTDKSILLADMNESHTHRLSTKSDLDNEHVVRSLASYYRDLHAKGKNYLSQHPDLSFYSEISLINKTSIKSLAEQTAYQNNEYWELVLRLQSELETYYLENRTLTYNDFFYGNLIISKTYDDAFMFDYNLLGEGLPAFDMSNVMSGLSKEMGQVFLESYGEINDYEVKINQHLSPIICLLSAFEKEKLPQWAAEDLELLTSGKLFGNLKLWLCRSKP